MINGVTIGNIAVKANDSDGVLIGAINAKKDETGVEASVENGRLVLAAKDGRAIIVKTHSDASFTIAGAKDSNWSVQGIAYLKSFLLNIEREGEKADYTEAHMDELTTEEGNA